MTRRTTSIAVLLTLLIPLLVLSPSADAPDPMGLMAAASAGSSGADWSYDRPDYFTAIPKDDRVELNWGPHGYPLGMMLFRTDDINADPGAASGYYDIARILPGETSYVDHDVAPGGRYVYYLEPWWNYLYDYRMVDLGKGLPEAPRELRAESSGHMVNITWFIPMDEGGTGVSSFNVYRSLDGGNFRKVGSLDRSQGLLYTEVGSSWFNTNVFRFRDNLSAEGKCQYAVSAVNEMGEGAWSLPTVFHLRPSPSNVSVKALTSTCEKDVIRLDWDPIPSQAEVACCKVYFTPFYRDYGTGAGTMTYLDSEPVATVGGNATSAQFEVEGDLNIGFRVCAVYQDGTEAYSDYAITSVGWCEGAVMVYEPLCIIGVILVLAAACLLVLLYIKGRK